MLKSQVQDGLRRPHEGLSEERCNLWGLWQRGGRSDESVRGQPVRRGLERRRLHHPKHFLRRDRGQHVLLDRVQQNGASVPPGEPDGR